MPCKYDLNLMPLEGTVWSPPIEKERKMLYGPHSRFKIEVIVRDASLLPDFYVGRMSAPIVFVAQTLEEAKAWCDKEEPSYEESPPDQRLRQRVPRTEE